MGNGQSFKGATRVGTVHQYNVKHNKGGVVTDSVKLRRLGVWSAASTAVLAIVAFGVAVTTPPRTGPFAAPDSLIAYPYSAAARFVPRDFFWMYPALGMMLAFVVMAAAVRERSRAGTAFATAGFGLTVASFTVIAVDYFIQLRTVQPSLLQGEADGLAIISQYNPHGVFIALEELGFLVAGIAFCFLALSLGDSRLERWIRGVLLGSSAILVATFIGLSAAYGMSIEYRFEVAAITIVWLTLAMVGVLFASLFAREEAGS